jgi:hypothetical protein
MSHQTVIFTSVLSRLLESFGVHLFSAIEEYERRFARHPANSTDIISRIFRQFPRKVPLYETIIMRLTDLAADTAGPILHQLSKLVKEILNDSKNTPFAVLLGISASYDPNNNFHGFIFYYFSLLFVSDLTCQIVAQHGPADSITFLSRAGYNIALSHDFVPSLTAKVVKQWSVIFSLLSEKDFSAISQIFSFFTSVANLTIPFLLMRFLRLDLDEGLGCLFFDQVVNLLKQHLKKKTVTNSMLQSMSCLIVMRAFSEDVFQRLHSLAWPYRTDKVIGNGICLLLCAILVRLPKMWKDTGPYVQKRMAATVNDSPRLKDSLRWLSVLAYGRNIDPAWRCWEWGRNSRSHPLSSLKSNGVLEIAQEDPRSATSVFMTTYFPRADFSACPGEFNSMILHLMSFDFQLFVRKHLPRFLELPEGDPRFLVILRAIPVANSPAFLTYAFKPVSADEINEFNSIVKPPACRALAKIQGESFSHVVQFGDAEWFVATQSIEADQKIGLVLDEWNVQECGELSVSPPRSSDYENSFSLVTELVPALPFVLSDAELRDPGIMRLLVELSCHSSLSVAQVAYDICRQRIASFQYLDVLTNTVRESGDTELSFIALVLLHSVLNSGMRQNDEQLRGIEMDVFMSLVSIYPRTRSLAVEVLTRLNHLMGDTGAMSFILPRLRDVEKNVQIRMLLQVVPARPEALPHPPSKIPFESALISHYYDVWMAFLTEFLNVLVAANYTPLFDRVEARKTAILEGITKQNARSSPADICIVLIVLDSQFHVPAFQFSSQRPLPKQYEPYRDRPDNRAWVCQTLHGFLQRQNTRWPQLALTVLRHLHFSLQAPMIDVLSRVSESNPHDVAWTLQLVFRQPEWTGAFFVHNFSRITAWLTAVQYHCAKVGLNSPRVVRWTPELEAEILRGHTLPRDICLVVRTLFSFVKTRSEAEWATPVRELMCRFLVNWASTTSPSLESLRMYAESALVNVLSVGRVFTDTVLFDEDANTFARLAVLPTILENHLDLLLDIFIKACYCQPFVIAERYFTAVHMAVAARDDPALLYCRIGSLLLLGMYFAQWEHPAAREFLSETIAVIEIENEGFSCEPSDLTNVPRDCSFAVEAVFAAFFALLKTEGVLVRLLIEAARPWARVTRLLPTQKSCAPGVLDGFRYFTPYQFLVALMDATDAITEPHFRALCSLWTDLQRSPDHTELVPLFVSEWRTDATKQKLFTLLLDADPRAVAQKLFVHCQFACYFHTTRVLGQKFDRELWVGPLLAHAFGRHWDDLSAHLPTVIHFAFLTRDQSPELLDALCARMHIERLDGNFRPETFREVVCLFAAKMGVYGQRIWGNECLKWLLGCASLRLAYRSFIVYNELLQPIDSGVTAGIVRAVRFHVQQASEQEYQLVAQFVAQSFIFFGKSLKGNEQLALNFLAAFLDCRVFFEAILVSAQPIIAKCVEHHGLSVQNVVSPVSLVRPLISTLETNANAQRIVNEVIRQTRSEELTMLVAPIKKTRPELFPDATTAAEATEATACQSLAHYSLMEMTASRAVLNNIFDISAGIVEVTVNENNRLALAKLYKSALRSLSTCPSAFHFIKKLCEKEPTVAQISVVDVFEWDRSMEDVLRSLRRISVIDDSPAVTITDCHSFTQVMRFLEGDVVPKILPFAANRELLEGMSRVELEKANPKEKTAPKLTGSRSFGGMVNSVSVVFVDSSANSDAIGPLIHPTALVQRDGEFERVSENWRKINPVEVAREIEHTRQTHM